LVDVAATVPEPRFLPNGDSAVTVEFARDIEEGASTSVLALDHALTIDPIAGITETVPTYRSLLVHYDNCVLSFGELVALLRQRLCAPVPAAHETRIWHIPVAYGGVHGPDLEDVAAALGMPADEVVARHTAGSYRVAMIGFTPGWSYLTGLDPTLHLPRRPDPRLVTPAGAIAIAGTQAGIQCLPGPSGWHLLGRTAVRSFQLNRDPIFLIEPGDRVTFFAVDDATFAAQERSAERGEIVALTQR